MIKDKLFNFWLSIKGWLRWKTRLSMFTDVDIIYKLNTVYTYLDRFENLNDWNKGLWWGDFHPNETKYTHDDEVNITSRGVKFTTSRRPTIHDGKEYRYSCGLIEHKQTFGHGYFEVKATCYGGKSLWNAPLWFVSKGDGSKEEFTSVPEFDVCEVYTDADGSNMHGNSDVHYGKTYEEELNAGPRTHTHKGMEGKPMRYGLLWEPNRLSVYYDGQLVRRFTNKKLVSTFNKKIMPIINSSVKNDKVANETTAMIVNYFLYYKLEK